MKTTKHNTVTRPVSTRKPGPVFRRWRWRALRWPAGLCALGLCGAALLAVGLIFLAQPVDDDFHRAILPRQQGWWGYVYHSMYLGWSGRWSGVGLSSFILPRVDPTRFYPLLLAGLHLTHFMGLAVAIRLLLGRRPWLGRRAAWAPWVLAAGVYPLLWSVAPSLGQTYYWFSGGMEYLLSPALACLLLGLIEHGAARGGGWRWRLAPAALAFWITGMHEIFAASLVAVLAAGWWVALRRRRAVGLWGTVLIAACVGFLVTYFAPGNRVRAALLPQDHDLWATVRAVGLTLGTVVLPWLLRPAVLAASVMVLLAPVRRPGWVRRGDPLALLVPGVTLAIVMLWIFGPTWVLGNLSGRVLDVTHHLLLLGWFTSLVAWRPSLRLRRTLTPRMRGSIMAGALAVLALAVMMAGNTPDVLRGWAQARHWHEAMAGQRREAGQARAMGLRDAVVAPLSVMHPVFFNSDGITPDPADWRNQGYAAFYGLSSIRTD